MAVRDVILAGVLIFVFGMAFFIVNFGTKVVVNEMVAIPTINNSQNVSQVLNATADTTDRLDYLIFGLFIGLILAILIASYFIAGNPIFVFLYFLVTVIGIAVSAVIANAWDDITSASIWTTILPSFTGVTAFPITNHIMTYLPYYTAVIGMLGLGVMFIRPYVETQ